MPELPEVELTRRALTRWTVGRPVAAVEVHDPKRFEGDAAALVGRAARGWERRGKYLIGRFDGVALLGHLGMTGKWVEDPGPERPHQRVVLRFGDGQAPARVVFIDPRRFGGCWVMPDDQLEGHPRLAELGPDPTAADFDGARLRAAAGRGAAPLKARLMDQRRVAGLGNIAASEIAWMARVHPHAPVDRVPAEAWDALAEATKEHVAWVIEIEGEGEVQYQSESEADNPFKVYGRAGQPCPRCGAAIARGVLGGRSSFWCPRCQPEAGEEA